MTTSAAWAAALMDGLAAGGVTHVAAAPGSRSGPLAVAAARHPGMTTSVHIDERSAAFHALGYGKATGRPAAAVCTSGTAGANFLPAVIEADRSGTPLVVVTADRPPALRDTGAWQTIDQIKLFGGHVRWFAEVAPPGEFEGWERYLADVGLRAAAVAAGGRAGPVHLNVPLTEPLGSIEQPSRNPRRSRQVDWGTPQAPPAVVAEVSRLIRDNPRGLIIAGPDRPRPDLAAGIAELARRSGYPVLADAASNLRFGGVAAEARAVLSGMDACLRHEPWARAMAPQVVLRFGASPTWKQVTAYLAGHGAATQVVVDPGATFDDPTRSAARRVVAEPEVLAMDVAALLPVEVAGGEEWREAWERAGEVVAEAIETAVAAAEPATSLWVPAAVISAAPDHAVIYAANSMAVRDLESFTHPSPRQLTVLVNRGAAGIDGTLSSALGAARGSGKPTLLLTGDLAFLHDVNGLAGAADGSVDLTVIVLNDDGGGIFAYLDAADLPEFDAYFRAPATVDLESLCRAYGVAYAAAASPSDLGAAVRASTGRPGVAVIEVVLDMERNTAAHRAYWAGVAGSLEAITPALPRR